MRPLVAWMVLLAMPFHALTGIYLDLRGPAHFHLHAHDDDDHDGHGHAQAERHRHAADDPSVVNVADDGASHAHTSDEGVLSGWSATMCMALLSSTLPLPAGTAGGIDPALDEMLRTRFPGCPERPPRLIPA
jgi:hypothetical protein